VRPAHVICSTNPPSNPATKEVWQNSTASLATLMEELRERDHDLRRIVFVSSNTDDDLQWCRQARTIIDRSPWPHAQLEIRYVGNHLDVATAVSQELEISRRGGAALIVDLTPGPKDRSAAIYVAASVLQSVTMLYAERHAGGFKHREVPLLGDFNSWMSRHGVLVRDYRQELADLPATSAYGDRRPLSAGELAQAIADLLVSSGDLGITVPGPRANLLTLMESVREGVWQTVMGQSRPSSGAAEDDVLRDQRNWDEWHRSAGRAAQALWVLRSLFAHSQPAGLQPQRPDAIAALDMMAFLAARLRQPLQESNEDAAKADTPQVFVILDGDDVGKRFTERLVTCADEKDMDDLADWSHGIQASLYLHMLTLQEHWSASFIAQTGDGFVARFPVAHLKSFAQEFRPTLLDLPVTVGVGPTVKDAFMALRLGKARNRGGGLFHSLSTGQEAVLWPSPAETLIPRP
jgi:hypothetical protein